MVRSRKFNKYFYLTLFKTGIFEESVNMINWTIAWIIFYFLQASSLIFYLSMGKHQSTIIRVQFLSRSNDYQSSEWESKAPTVSHSIVFCVVDCLKKSMDPLYRSYPLLWLFEGSHSRWIINLMGVTLFCCREIIDKVMKNDEQTKRTYGKSKTPYRRVSHICLTCASF